MRSLSECPSSAARYTFSRLGMYSNCDCLRRKTPRSMIPGGPKSTSAAWPLSNVSNCPLAALKQFRQDERIEMPRRFLEPPGDPRKRFLDIRLVDVDDSMFDTNVARDGRGSFKLRIVAGPPCRQRNAGPEAAPCCLRSEQGGIDTAAEQDGDIAVPVAKACEAGIKAGIHPIGPRLQADCLPARAGTPASSTAFRLDSCRRQVGQSRPASLD